MSDASNGNGVREHVLLFRRFLRNPRTIGAITPSSPGLAKEMVAGLPSHSGAHVIELGPGTGAFTGAIVDRVGPGGRFLAVDIEPEFVKQIRQRFPRVECVRASAEELERLVGDRAFGPVDHILSGLPFASLPPRVTARILEAVDRTLRIGGTFTAFQYVHAYRLATARQFRREASRRLGGPPVIRLVVKNFPPAFVMTWTKHAHAPRDVNA